METLCAGYHIFLLQWRYLTLLSLSDVSHEKKYMVFSMPYTNEFLTDQPCLVMMTRYGSHFLYVNSVSFLNNLIEFGKYPKQS